MLGSSKLGLSIEPLVSEMALLRGTITFWINYQCWKRWRTNLHKQSQEKLSTESKKIKKDIFSENKTGISFNNFGVNNA